jgi:hypothetical protein
MAATEAKRRLRPKFEIAKKNRIGNKYEISGVEK